MKKSLKLWVAGSLLAFAGACCANPYETTLPNGLRVIVKEDHRAPSVVHMIWYRTGSIDELDGDSGLAHALEHMMFKGTTKFPTGEFNRRVAAAGGRDNAFTNLDYTAYYQNVPKRALPEMMMLEADRMQNLQFRPAEFAKEIQVIMEERRMRTEDNPLGLVHEALYAAAFVAHPYHRPVIGWMDDLEHMTVDDIRKWHDEWYVPNNAYVVIVGDVNKDEAFKLAQKYYGKLKPRAVPVRKPQNEPAQKGIRRVTVKAPASLPYIAMGWKVPKLKDIEKDKDPYALEVLAAVLDGHEAARLARNLVRGSRIAQGAGADYDSTLRGEALFILDGQPGAGHSLAELEAALRAELKRIQEQGVSAEELELVKTQLIAGQIYKRDSMMAQATEIGSAEAAGVPWQKIERLQEKLRAVTPAEVQAVAKKYFNDDTLTVATLDPQPIDPKAPKKSIALPHQ